MNTTSLVTIIHNPDHDFGPSSEKAVQTFRGALAAQGLESVVETVEEGLAAPLKDACFIRAYTETGGAAHSLAERYERNRRPVIDRPASIVRGCDKIHQAMLFARAGIATPATRLVTSLGHLKSAVQALGSWPIVAKDPGGAFCSGIGIAHSAVELEDLTALYLSRSGGVVLQAFMPTEFDWRIGVLDGRPLFAAQYWMAPDSWKIRKSGAEGSVWGAAGPVALAAAPRAVVATAVAAADVMGPGLWGVDLKVVGNQVFVIEVNDNPNIDDDCEAAVPQDQVWGRLATWFRDAVEQTAERQRASVA